MSQDPRWTVRTSFQTWGAQVDIIDGLDAYGYPGDGKEQTLAALEKRQPVNYEFDGGRRVFRMPLNPYA